jgi:hypothetical protein
VQEHEVSENTMTDVPLTAAQEQTIGKEVVALEEAIAFAKKMRVVADAKKVKCVDGGYRTTESEGAIAFPGGFLGLSMALLEFGIAPREAFTLVYDFASEKGMPYSWHTDTHEGHHGAVVGCGHCNAAMKPENAQYYGVNESQVAELLTIVREAQQARQQDGSMELVVLDRNHTERAILVITSTDYTVKPWDQEKNEQFFIYDQVRHEELLKEFVIFLEKQGVKSSNDVPITFEDLLSASKKQLNATLGLLGTSKGAQLFTVDVSNEEPVVTELKERAPDLTVQQ